MLGSLLWKEWRDHRAPLLAFPVAIAPLIALGVTLLPKGLAQNPSLPTLVSFGALVIAALTLVADLIPGEEQRGTIRLLQRLPVGLTRAFVAKAAIGLLASGAFCAAAYLWTTLASAGLRGGPWFPRIDLGRWFRYGTNSAALVEWWPIALVFVAWILPVSAWLPRGSLALPAAVLVLTAAVGPLLLIASAHPGFSPPRSDVVFAWGALVLGAPLVAGFSFVAGRRRGGGLRASAWRGLLATALLVAPAYARVNALAEQWSFLDPEHASLRIQPFLRSFVSVDGRHAFLTAEHDLDRRGPQHALVVNLADGSWKTLGEPGDEFRPVAGADECNAVPFVALRPEKPSGPNPMSWLSRWVVLDTATLETVARASARVQPDPFSSTDQASAVERATNALRLADGTRVWDQAGELVAEAPSGDVRVLPDSKHGATHPLRAVGHGFRFWRNGRSIVYDATRERRVELPEDVSEVQVRAGRWVVERKTEDSRREQCLFDPDTRQFTPLPPSVAKLAFEDVVDDGRLLAFVRTKGTPNLGTIALVDPESGVVEPVEMPAWFEGQLEAFRVEGRTPSGAPVILLRPVQGRLHECHTRLELAARRLTPAGDASQTYSELLGCVDEETLILLENQKRLVRARFGAAEMEVLFPASARSAR